MSCVYTSLLKSLDSKLIESKFCEKINNPMELLRAMKRVDRFPREIRINNTKIKETELKQALETLKNIDSVMNGYEMGFGDPSLLIWSSVFNVEIFFNFNGKMIHITTILPDLTLQFKSDKKHFEFVNRTRSEKKCRF